MSKFEEIQKRVMDYWGFKMYNKGKYFKTRYCVVNDLRFRDTKWIGYRTLKQIEKIYLSDKN